MGYRVKPFTMAVRDNSTQQFIDVGLLGSDVDADVESLKFKTPWITPEMFGAVGDGITDDTNALRQCFAHGGKILIPNGKVYGFSNYIPVYSDSDIQFDGILSAIQSGGENGETSLEFFSRTTGVYGYDGVHDVIIHGSGCVDMHGDIFTEAYATPLRIHHASNITVRGITVKNYSKYHGFEIGGSTDVLIEDVKILGCFANGTTGMHEAIQIECISETGTGNALYYDGTICKNITIRGCYFGPSDEGGSIFTAIGTHDASALQDYYENIVIEDCIFDRNTHFTIHFAYNIEKLTIRNNKFLENSGSVSIVLEHRMRDCLVEYNNFYDNAVAAIWIGANSQTVDSNDLLERVLIRNNYIKNYNTICTSSIEGIGIRGVNHDCAVVDNTLIFDTTYSNLPIRIVGLYIPYSIRFVAQNNTINGLFVSSANTLEHTESTATLSEFLNKRIDAIRSIAYTKGVYGLSDKNVVSVYGARTGYYEMYSVAYLNKANDRVTMISYPQPTNLKKIILSQFQNNNYSHYETVVSTLTE